MKRKLLISIAVCTCLTASAQRELPLNANMFQGIQLRASDNPKQKLAPVNVRLGNQPQNVLTVNKVNIGSSANAYSTAYDTRSILYADPSTNSVVMVYRGDPSIGDPSSGHLYYSRSVDGGLTFLNHNLCYAPAGGPFYPARYPQGAIYNPAGNTDPGNAYFNYLAPSLAGGNSAGYGGYVNGSASLIGTTTTQNENYFPHAGNPLDFCMLQNTGAAIGVDYTYDTINLTYNQKLLFYKGIWNGSDFNYTASYLPAPVALLNNGTLSPRGSVNMAFGPDGLTGYAALIGHLDFNLVPDSNVAPIIYKTTDGGNTWTSLGTLIFDNCESVLNTGSTHYFSVYDCDLAVDANGECHLVVMIVRSANDFTGYFYDWGVFDFYSSPTGWNAQLISRPLTNRGFFSDAGGTLGLDNRFQASRTFAGDKIFFTYFDTDTNVYGGGGSNGDFNLHPDLWCAAYDVNTCMWMPATDLTAGTSVGGECIDGNVSPYVLGSAGTYNIPVAILEFTNGGPNSSCTHYYLQGLEVTDAQFNTPCSPISISIATGINDPENPAASFSVSQNVPNPFNSVTSFSISSKTGGNFTVEITNVLGQLVKSETYKNLGSGQHLIKIDVVNMQQGVYYYTVKHNAERITKKMIVE